MRGRRGILYCFATIWAVPLLEGSALAAESGFTVESGVLTRYTGPGRPQRGRPECVSGDSGAAGVPPRQPRPDCGAGWILGQDCLSLLR